MVLYASAISPTLGLIDNVVVSRDAAIMSLMLLVGGFIDLSVSRYKQDCGLLCVQVRHGCLYLCTGCGMVGGHFVSGHSGEIKELARTTVSQYPALLAVVFFLAAMLLYSQAATAKAITPAIVTALGITAANPDDSYMLVASLLLCLLYLCYQLTQPFWGGANG